MLEYLEGFEKRMQFVAVTESIINRKNTNLEIEGWFLKDQLDNLFFSLLVYIMEQTLNENDECTIENIAKFLDDVLEEYDIHQPFADVIRLAEYMVKDILQNKGSERTYGIMDYEKGWQNITIRLIRDKVTADNQIIYQLTDQGYDFLFRTKEVDRELDFKLEQMKLKELLRRKNYKHALRQSRDLIAMLRQKKRELEEFVYRIRQNIYAINRGEHQRLLKETYDLIDEEYKGMEDLKLAVSRDEERIEKEMQEVMNIEEPMRGALDNLNKIKRNLQIVIAEQLELMGKRFQMNDVYEETIKNSFLTAMVKRYDFEKEILEQLQTVDEHSINNLWQLFTPLLRPRPNKKLNLSLIYQNQLKLQEIEEEASEILEERLEEDQSQAEIQKRNQFHYAVVDWLFSYAGACRQPFHLSQFYHHLEDNNQIHALTESKQLFLVMLKLYEMGSIDLNHWLNRNREEVISEANGEFDLAWVLYQLEMVHTDFYGIRKLDIKGSTETFLVKAERQTKEGLAVNLEMTNLQFQPQHVAKAADGLVGKGETE